ncbi:tetratricopeptide repeat protein [Pseudoalteromonas sp. G4]|uniref:tetratricopeptide repeat protein n=1 Tax=Pseudoalteromonas sp. G4 TaxID=2992761 RepID=UPI00237E4BBF|nr:tetratricopeptide repeat protein [Pseudoalteromonas sp. G4]MDE3271895.1 tetratricopeptide repeat protein [Pseudoalteromonas sp. G4]
MYTITKKLSVLIISATALTANYVLADQSVVDNIEIASQHNNVEKLTELTESSQGFDKALASYRLAIAKNITGNINEALLLLDNAESILSSEAQSLDKSEVNALLAQIYGYRIAIKPISGFHYGIKSSNALKTAFEINQSNPRAHLIKGISAYNTPALFGGSKQQALNALNTSIKYFQMDNNSGYQWGQAEAYVWRGLTHLALNDTQNALKDWHKSLELEPNYAWAQMLINSNQG